METMGKFAKQLKKCIARKQNRPNINYEQAAKEMKMAKSTLFNILNENQNPTIANLKPIIEYTGCMITCDCEGDLYCIRSKLFEKSGGKDV